jgi:xylulose-5-phosphate/fructose-6-phosphate phosphoketolase
VIAACGDVPTLEALAATDALEDLGLKIRFVNVVKLLAIQNASENDQAISDEDFKGYFGPEGTPVLFAFHAYAGTIHRLIWDRPNHDSFHVHGYEEQGSTTTPYDMLRQNHMDRWALASDVLSMVDKKRGTTAYAQQIKEWLDFREEAFQFAVDNGYDHPRFTEWVWRDVVGHQDNSAAALSSTGGDNDE